MNCDAGNGAVDPAAAEREALLRELFHRSNNNLQMIISLLEMQCARTDSEMLRSFVTDVENRIVSMSLIHQQLYQSHDLSSIDLGLYLRNLSKRIFENFSIDVKRIELDFDTDEIMTLVDTALPLGMVYNELLTNSLKHAFPENRAGKVSLAVRKMPDEKFNIFYSDNGIGVPEGFDFRKQASVGLNTIFGISETQLLGKVTVKNEKGISWHIELSEKLYSKRI